MADIRQTKKYAKYLKSIGWKVERVGKNFLYIKKILPLGSIIKIQRPEEVDLNAFDYVYNKHHALQVIIEPKDIDQTKIIKDKGFRKSSSPYLPTKTLYLNLENSIGVLFDQLKKDARYSLRKTKDLKVYSVDNIEKFRKSWKRATNIRRWIPTVNELSSITSAFGNDVIFLVTPDGESGAVFLFADEIGYYWQAFSSKIGRKRLAQYKTVWTGINWAKKKGARLFDFEGIFDERFPNKRWKGFTHFKKSFGGYEVNYPGTFVKIRLPR